MNPLEHCVAFLLPSPHFQPNKQVCLKWLIMAWNSLFIWYNVCFCAELCFVNFDLKVVFVFSPNNAADMSTVYLSWNHFSHLYLEFLKETKKNDNALQCQKGPVCWAENAVLTRALTLNHFDRLQKKSIVPRQIRAEYCEYSSSYSRSKKSKNKQVVVVSSPR